MFIKYYGFLLPVAHRRDVLLIFRSFIAKHGLSSEQKVLKSHLCATLNENPTYDLTMGLTPAFEGTDKG